MYQSIITLVSLLGLISVGSAQDCTAFTAYLVIDGSQSIGPNNFESVKNATVDFITQSIALNPANRIGLVVYSDDVTDVVNASSNSQTLIQQARNIAYPASGTRTDLAITATTQRLLNDPFQYPKLMIVITDGVSNQPAFTQTAATAARNSGIIIIAVGIDEVIRPFPTIVALFQAELNGITANTNYTYLNGTFNTLAASVSNIAQQICDTIVSISVGLQDYTVLVGSNVVFWSSVSQTNVQGTWSSVGNANLAGIGGYTINAIGMNQTLSISNVQLNQAGTYTLAVTGGQTTGLLTVLDLLNNEAVDSGQTARFETRVSPSTNGIWTRNGVPLQQSAKYNIVSNGETRILEINNAQPADAGVYVFTVNGVPTTGVLTVRVFVVDGGYTEWSPWNPNSVACPVTCGLSATKPVTRTRTCTNPEPQNGGLPCQGSPIETTDFQCNLAISCPVDGGVSLWGDWGQIVCDVSCGFSNNGVQRRSRTCDNPPPSDGGAFCSEPLTESRFRPCDGGLCPVDGGFSEWTAWENTICSLTCGGSVPGFSSRVRFCNNPTPRNGGQDCVGSRNETRTGLCNTPICPVDGNWGGWAPWQRTCFLTCGPQVSGSQTRTRECNNPAPLNGGSSCPGLNRDTQTTICFDLPSCPVNGGFTPWTSWVETCSLTCGLNFPGTSRRTRSCTNPAPANGGADCIGDVVDVLSITCNTGIDCPIDGNWRAWGAWSEVCPRTCGNLVQGQRSRLRTCDDPPPIGNGAFCQGEAFEFGSFICSVPQCAVDGGFSPWTPWISVGCDVTCGSGLESFTRNRLCNAPSPQFGGANCSGAFDDQKTEFCSRPSCAIDGGFTPWSQWNDPACSVTCGTGIQTLTRTRTCTNPVPQNGGLFCSGANSDTFTRICVETPCPVDGGVGPWAQWTILRDCNGTCGADVYRLRQRTRACDSPFPANGGADCTDPLGETGLMNCGFGDCPIDGGVTPWGQWSSPDCTPFTCGSFRQGNVFRTRTCTNPVPQNGGSFCVDPLDETTLRNCGFENCPIDGGFTEWSPWVVVSGCSVTCGGGTQQLRAERTCTNPSPAFGGRPCQGPFTNITSIPCNTDSCPIDGQYGEWGQWSQADNCTVTCGGGTERWQRNRFCNNPAPAFGGANCVGTDIDFQPRPCNTFSCPVDGGFNNWSQWSPFGTCSVTCGTGTQQYQRTRQCNSPFPQFGGADCIGSLSDFETRTCTAVNCPIDGVFSQWTPYAPTGACSVTCGGGSQVYLRSRLCNSPAPAFGGADCVGLSSGTETRLCNNNNCPIDGQLSVWTQWTPLGGCSETCGGGSQTFSRNRFCNNPAPAFGGADCVGLLTGTETRTCNTNNCPIDGGFTLWNQWTPDGPCDRTCGGGVQPYLRSRTCTNPTPAFGGLPCQGSSSETGQRPCNVDNCPVDGGYTPWVEWTEVGTCSVTCGGGSISVQRTRTCTNPIPQFGGADCTTLGVPQAFEQRGCNDVPCPIDGGFSNWGPWDNPNCPVTCGGGVRQLRRSRACNNPTPTFGGLPCQGSTVSTETRTCSNNDCPIDGVFGPWAQWSIIATCSATCGTGTLTELRDRQCDQPPPQFGGADCVGNRNEQRTRLCNTNNCPVDGGYSPWGAWDNPSCPVTCGGGTRELTRSRVCNSPTPAFGGLPCQGSTTSTEVRTCNDNPCPIDGGYNAWSPWSPTQACSRTCGGGSRPYRRNRDCNNPVPAFGGLSCVGLASETETRSCNPFQCPIDGGYSPWAQWTQLSGCSVTCGGGQQSFGRTRECDNPVPQFGGLQCQDSSNEVITRACSIGGCPVNGGYNEWTNWVVTGPCSATCGGGSQPFTRNRICNNPVPLNGGLPCSGPDTDSTTRGCNPDNCPVDGGFGFWAPWDNPICNVTCGGGYRSLTRSRQCNNPTPRFGGADCIGTTVMTETRTCSNALCPIDGAYGPWANWTTTQNCPVTCGGGTLLWRRTRLCNNPAPQNGGLSCTDVDSQSETRICNADNCPVDGGITLWSNWISFGCNPTCGPGISEYRYRTRNCTEPPPQFGGQPCGEGRFQSETRDCNNPNCPVDGNWAPWTAWSTPDCGVTCGLNEFANVTRTRTCTDPIAQFGGANCVGSSVETATRRCNLDPCPIDGEPSPWAPWVEGPCSLSCGPGSRTATRSRTCTNPAPSFGGADCIGPLDQTVARACNEGPCPIDGGFVQWTPWNTLPCALTCGRTATTNQTRERTCTFPTPAFGGLNCVGDSFQYRAVSCNNSDCPVDGGLTPWTQWSPGSCSATCGPGVVTRQRTRSCTNPMPQFGGRTCIGATFDTDQQSCNERTCPTDGGFTLWGPWDNPVCPVSCGGGVRTLRRSRTCTNPTPSIDGLPCIGSYTDTESRACGNDICPIDGQLTPWTEWNIPQCPQTCGFGIFRTINRTRTCTNPAPQFGGLQCTGATFESASRQCFLPGCPVNGNWSPWSPYIETGCSRTCGTEATRYAYRTRNCTSPAPSNGGIFCPGDSFEWELRNCNLPQCPIDGNWTPWSTWAVNPCTDTCGNATTSAVRTRTCTNPAPQFGGQNCLGESTAFRSQSCNLPVCPVDGGVGPWTAWTPRDCGVTCGVGVTAYVSRDRECDNPIPSNGGAFCTEDLFQSRYESCNLPACPIDGNWGAWNQWSNPVCSETCGFGINGTVGRFRPCNNPAPSNGGLTCPGSSSDTATRPCTLPRCQVDGNWSPWQPWNDPPCDRTCGGGTRRLTRTRTCDNPAPQFNGVTCPGTDSDATIRTCSENPCPVDGQWSQWTPWSVPRCAATCGPTLSAQVTRSRQCNSPVPQNGGLSCPGTNTQAETQSCQLPFCPIDGQWSPWTQWATPDCPVTCGGANITRRRLKTCTNPIPTFGGQFCPGVPEEAEMIRCGSNPCPLDGNWSEWSPWSDPLTIPCPVTCGTTATKNIPRFRTCTNPAPLNGGRTCDGTNLEFYPLNCGLDHCIGDVEGLCRTAVNLGGVGYREHPEDCNRYIQCYYNTTNDITAVYRSCPFGYYWDQVTLRCDHSWKVPCDREKCTNDCDTTYDMEGSCRAYWACEDGVSIGQCCENEYRYVAGRGCLPDPYCTDPCPVPCLRSKEACDKRPVWDNMRSFNIRAGSIGWVSSSCPTNRVYDIVTCSCVDPQVQCNPRQEYNFASIPAGWQATNVNVFGGAARFNSNSRLVYSTRMGQIGGPSTLQFSYRETSQPVTRQMLLSSTECEDCNNATTISISIFQIELVVQVTVWNGAVVRIPISTEGFSSALTKQVTVIYRNEDQNRALLTVVVRAGNYEYIHEEYAPRGLDLYRCGMTFGSETDVNGNSFNGELQSMAFFECERRTLFPVT